MNLCHLISEMHLSSDNEPRLAIKTLKKYSQNLFALSGPRGELAAYILRGRLDLAKERAQSYLEIFGKDFFFIELQNHLLPSENILNRALFRLACKENLLVVATNNVYYISREDYELHQILVRASQIVHHQNTRPTPNEEYYLKTPPQMARLFGRYPAAIANAALVAEECDVKLNLGGIISPAFPIPQGEKDHEYLLKQCFKRLSQKYHSPDRKAASTLIRELKVIERKGFSSYFLLVADIVSFAKKKGIRCSARGSASGSIVAYLLDISQNDPLKYNLLFERFLNPERNDLPDIDLDFDSRRRDEVTEYVLQKYDAKAALVATVPTFRARGALREVARSFGLSYEKIENLTNMIPYLPADKIRPALEVLPELKENELRKKEYQKIVNASEKVDGFPRHLSCHLGGVVISRGHIQDLVPMQKSGKGFSLSQYDKDDLEKLGLIKTDLLSLRMLGAISEALEHLRIRGVNLDLEKIQFDDDRVYGLLSSTKTVGCFQLESPGMRQLLGKLQPTNFNDIIACISLFRPGPMQADMITPFLERRHGKAKMSYLHSDLEPILKDTYGVIIFHEQVLRIAQSLAGFSLGQGDLLRRSMTKKITPEEKEKLREDFLSGCKENGVSEEVAQKVFGQLTAFGAFGFCRAHAVSFAKIAYQSAYLKTYYPAEFFLGLLNNEPGLYPKMVLLNEAKRCAVQILPPNINQSQGNFSLENGALRVGLSCVRKMGPSSLKEILEKRRGKEFSSLRDFNLRVKIDRSLLENLIISGCFSSLNGKGISHSLETYKSFSELFKNSNNYHEKNALLELNALGLTVNSHPLVVFKENLNRIERVKSNQLSTIGEGRTVKVAGTKVILHTPPTKSGQRVIFLTLEDEEGLIDVTVFPSAQELYASDIFESNFLLIEGYIQRNGKNTSIIANKAFDLRKI